MSAKTYNWGFVAAGRMAQIMAHDLALLPNAQVYSVVSRTAQSSHAFAKQFAGCRQFESLERLLADHDVDIIYISSPNHLHYPQVKAALLARKPVLCEKPFTLNARQLAELIEIARKNETFLMEAMWIRWLPIVMKLRELLAQRTIGEPRLLKASFHAQLNVDPMGRIYNLAMGGGSLLDLGIYPISFASLVFGQQPDEIASVALIGKTEIDEHFSASFRYGSAAMAAVSAGVDGLYREDISVHGDAGSIRIESPWKMSLLHLESRDGDNQIFTLPFDGRGYSYQAVEVMRCLDDGLLESPVIPLDESLAIMQTLDRLRAQWKLVFPDERSPL